MEFDKSKFVYYIPSAAPPTPPEPEPPAAEPEPVEEPPVRFSPPAVRNLVPLPPAPSPEPAHAPSRKSTPLTSRNMVILASAAVGLLILGTYLAHRNAEAKIPVRPPEIVEHLDTSVLSALPEPLQAPAQALLSGTFQPPAWLQSMDPGSGNGLEYPAREAIEETQPTLRWAYAQPSANVAVLDPTHKVVARAEVFNQNRWTLPLELQRGVVYTWEIHTAGQVGRSAFRILDETEAGWLQGLRLSHPDSHLLIGAATLELGLFSQAQREFQALMHDHPHSPEAAQLLRVTDGFVAH